MASSNNPRWHFPPRNGGIDFVHDPSAAFFNDNPIPKLVREVIQNSLDARESGIAEPVSVAFADTQVDRSLIGASQLYRHLTSCLDRAVQEGRSESIQGMYERAVETLKNSHVRCLRITDNNTTGLIGDRWEALVIEEGGVRKSDTGAPGGNFGIGKNAVFNVSDIQTVFYSTHYIDTKIHKGRVDKLQGKATLMSHPNPDNSNESLQHIGFYQDESMQPIIGRREIDRFFQLSEPGTGVFIMGFNPRTDRWVDEIVRAVLQNFFYAIHHQSLVVSVENGESTIEIKHDNLEPLFERYDEDDSSSHYYYRAIRDAELETTKPISNLGAFDVFIHLNGGPKRMAFVNRNGMLISDSREQKSNPIYTRNRPLWPDYAAVILPSTDSVDKMIRDMENPSHDAISVAQLREPGEQRKMRNAFKNARDAIKAIMDNKTHLDQSGHQANLRELAEMFPELDSSQRGVTSLVTREVTYRNNSQESFVESDSEGEGEGNSERIDPDIVGDYDSERDPGEPNGVIPDPTDDPSEDLFLQKRNVPGELGTKGGRKVPIKGVRVMTTSEKTVLVCFTPTGTSPHEVKFSLKAAGEEYLNTERLSIVSAGLKETKTGQKISAKDDIVTLSAKETERVIVEIETSDSVANVAFRLGVMQ